MIMWLLGLETDTYYDSLTTTPIAVFSDPSDAFIYADEDYEYFSYRKREHNWHWDDADQRFVRLVCLSGNSSSIIVVSMLELNPV